MVSPFIAPEILREPWRVPGDIIPQVFFYQKILGVIGTHSEICHTFNQPNFCFMLQSVRIRSAIIDPITAIQFAPVTVEISHAATGRTIQNVAGESQDIAIPGTASTWQFGTYPGEFWVNYPSENSRLFFDEKYEELFLPSDGVLIRLKLDTNNPVNATNPVQVVGTGILFRGDL
jgi:hypothetical protein